MCTATGKEVAGEGDCSLFDYHSWLEPNNFLRPCTRRVTTPFVSKVRRQGDGRGEQQDDILAARIGAGRWPTAGRRKVR